MSRFRLERIQFKFIWVQKYLQSYSINDVYICAQDPAGGLIALNSVAHEKYNEVSFH